jgi:hypothetical protein
VRVFLITQSTTEMVLTLVASLVGFRRQSLVTCGEVVFAEMVKRSAAVNSLYGSKCQLKLENRIAFWNIIAQNM